MTTENTDEQRGTTGAGSQGGAEGREGEVFFVVDEVHIWPPGPGEGLPLQEGWFAGGPWTGVSVAPLGQTPPLVEVRLPMTWGMRVRVAAARRLVQGAGVLMGWANRVLEGV